MNFRRNMPATPVGFQMAPLIDIVFLCLIFFMVSSVVARWEAKMGITVPTAASGARSSRDVGEIIINVDAAGAISINNVSMTTDRLQSVLSQVGREFKDQPVIIRADAQTRHERVIAVLDACRHADIWNVAFATLPPPPAAPAAAAAPAPAK